MRLIPAIGAVVMLQACAATDPQLNRNDWRPTGVNARNIAAQVVDPMDLVRGRGATVGADGNLAAAAVARLRADHVKPLPDSGISDIKVQSTGSAASSP
jgi:type IV pilus biogenesis protein CpaD/CtpE